MNRTTAALVDQENRLKIDDFIQAHLATFFEDLRVSVPAKAPTTIKLVRSDLADFAFDRKKTGSLQKTFFSLVRRIPQTQNRDDTTGGSSTNDCLKLNGLMISYLGKR